MSKMREAWPVAAIVLVVGLVNISTSPQNNWNIALLQLAFVLGTILCLRPSLQATRSLNPILVLICLSMAISNVLAGWDDAGLADWQRAIDMLAHLGFALAIFHWFCRRPSILHWVVAAKMLAVLTYFFVLVGFWLYLETPYSHSWFGDPPLFNHIRHLGMFLLVGTVMASWAVLAYPDRRRGPSWAIFVVALSMLLWSGSRGAVIAAGGGIALLGFKFASARHQRTWVLLGLGAALAFALSAVFDVGQNGLGWLRAIERSVTAASVDQLSSSRLTIWSYLIPFVAERPWFGWGGEAFQHAWPTNGIIQAHNGVFQLMLEWGAVGTILILGPLGWIAIKGGLDYVRTASTQPADSALPLGMSLVTALSIMSLVDGVFYHGTPMAFLMLGFGMVGASLYRAKDLTEGGPIARS